jgi:hypothetical protein
MVDNFKGLKVLGTNVMEILDRVLEDQALCKLLHYSSDNPLAEPEIEDTFSLVGENIFLVPSMDFESIEKNYLVCSLENFSPTSSEFFDYRFVFYVLCPKSQWILNDRTLRPFYIMERIYDLFEGHKMSMGGLQLAFGEGLVITPQLLGYQMFFLGTDFI